VTASAFGLVILAAFLHATWNALAKRSTDAVVFLWLAWVVASLALGPLAAYILVRDGVPAAALPFVAATVALHGLYFYALGRSYGAGDFSLVYPVARGLGVGLVPLLALVVFDERPSPLGLLGVMLVVAGIVALHLGPRGPEAGTPRAWAGPATWWAVLTGLTIAGYSLVDKAGVARLNPVPYLGLMNLGVGLLLAPTVLRRRGAVRREWRRSPGAVVAVGLMSFAAYLLVLFAFRLSKVSYVVAARELSIVISAFLGTLWLGEGRLAPRLAGAVIVLAGVGCIALAR
jgi:drug/metabolite transporter (DMT)-like permease